jgi:hypothetical protein
MKLMALESIAFQSGVFFKDLTECVKNIVEKTSKDLSDKDYVKTNEFDKLVKCVKDHTGLWISFEIGGANAATYVPDVNANHILHSNELKEIFNLNQVETEKTILDLSRKYSKSEIKGYVDLKKSKVSGVFSEIHNHMYINRRLINGGRYTPAEIASFIIHEIGHVFTFFEYSTRIVSTNQALSLLASTIDNRMSLETKEIVFLNLKDKVGLDQISLDALKQSKTKEEASLIILNCSIEKTKSEIGSSLYDYTSCEYLADQFASRHGAARDLSTALDKLRVDMLYMSAGVYVIMLSVMSVYMALTTGTLVAIPLFIGMFTVITIIATILSKDGKDNYDNDKSRIQRLKNQNTERLKNPKLSSVEKKLFIEQNESIDKLLKLYSDNKSVFEFVAYYIKPSYRTAKDYEDLQKSLEKLGSNTLFEKAAKLSII